MNKYFINIQGLTLLVLLFTFIVLTTSCQKDKLKSEIEKADKKCPINLGEMGIITDITYDDKNVTYTYLLNKGVTIIKTIKEDPEDAKETVKSLYSNPNKSTKALIDLMIKNGAGLNAVFIDKETGEKASFELSNKDLKSLALSKGNNKENGLNNLKAEIKVANLQFPASMGYGMTILKIELTDKAVIYQCEMDENISTIDQMKKQAAQIKQNIIESLSNLSEPGTKEFIGYCFEYKRELIYRFKGNSSNEQFDVTIGMRDLANILTNKKDK